MTCYSMWKIERDEDYFRIFDSKKDIAAYFDPDYGDLFPQEKEQEIIEQMHKTHDKIAGGFIMVPMVKFGIFDANGEMDINQLQNQLDAVAERLTRWESFLSETDNQAHSIRVSHTDQDMLSITFPIKFDQPIPLEKNTLLGKIEPILDLMQKQGLL